MWRASIGQHCQPGDGKILPVVKDWQNRPLQFIYAAVFLDVIHSHVCSEGQFVKKAVYVAIEVYLDGCKKYWCYIIENESVKYWATMLNSL